MQENTQLVQKQYPPFYIVKSNGTCINYTDDRTQAHASFNMSPAPDKSIFRIDGKGITKCVRRMLGGTELGVTCAATAE